MIILDVPLVDGLIAALRAAPRIGPRGQGMFRKLADGSLVTADHPAALAEDEAAREHAQQRAAEPIRHPMGRVGFTGPQQQGV